MTEPFVSVGLYVRNMERYIERAVTTILAQTHRNIELVISDNTSTDNTVAILKRLAATDGRIRLICQEKNIGAFNNMAYVFSQTTGDYFMWASADDYWDPEFIRTLLAELDAHPDAHVAMSAVKVVDEEGNPKKEFRLDGPVNPNHLSHVRNMLFISASHPNIKYGKRVRSWNHKQNVYNFGLFRRPFIERVFDYFPNMAGCDRIFFTLMALVTPFRYVDETLFHRTVYKKLLIERQKEESTGQWSKADKRKVILATMKLGVKLFLDDLMPFWRRLFIPLAVARLIRVMALSPAAGR